MRRGDVVTAGEGKGWRKGARGLLAVLALALCALALTAAPASADPPIIGEVSVTNILGGSAHVSATVGALDAEGAYFFEYSTNDFASDFRQGPSGQTPPNAEPTSVQTDLTGLHAGTTYWVRVLVFDGPEGDFSPLPNTEFITPPILSPKVLAIDDAADLTDSSAIVSGSIERPAGVDPSNNVDCHFEYVSDEQFAATGFEGATQIQCGPSNPVSATGPVTGSLTGLAPNTSYHLRLTGTNAGGSASLEANTFRTIGAPAAQTLGAGGVQEDAAILAGRVNPRNGPVTYQFEWGAKQSQDDETYEYLAPEVAEPLGVADNAFHVLIAPIGELTPTTTYHYRIAATNTLTGKESFGQDQTFATRGSAPPAVRCPHESSRVGASANLPDCRAYEWASPGLNDASITSGGKRVLDDGSAFLFQTYDAVDDAVASETLSNKGIARRGPQGWTTKSLLPPVIGQVRSLFQSNLACISADLSQSVVTSGIALVGPDSPAGLNYYLRRTDGSWEVLTNTGVGGDAGLATCLAARDFTRIFFTSLGTKQLPSDPTNGGNLYEWANGELGVVAYLPNDDQPAPNGGMLASEAAVSENGAQVLFYEGTRDSNGQPNRTSPDLYMRSEGKTTVEVSASQRNVEPDPNPPANAEAIGITPNGSTVLFTSRSELTNDANTGRTDGAASDQGNDLYSYDVVSGDLADLTADHNPADAAAGADVERVFGLSRDYSYVYFVARGNLAPGGISGERNLYVSHEGRIDFVGSDPAGDNVYGYPFYVTPDGRHAAFGSPMSQTGYDNAGYTMVYKYTYGMGLECVSCRPSGALPTADATILNVSGAPNRAISDDGSRVFFESPDSILPQATNGLANVYEYEGGELHLLTPGDGKFQTHLLGVSASGDDVFITAHEMLSPKAPGDVSAVYDARVDAELAEEHSADCEGEACRSQKTTPSHFASPGTSGFQGSTRISLSKPKGVKAAKIQLRLLVPEGGEVKISGRGVVAVKRQVTNPGSLGLTISLTASADKRRLRKGVFRTKAEVLFTSVGGETSRAEVSLKFEAAAKRKGGR